MQLNFSTIVSALPLCSVESTALRLITALGSSEVQPQFTRFLSDPKTVLSAESEELNRALILTLARATHVTGTVNTLPPATDTDASEGAVSPDSWAGAGGYIEKILLTFIRKNQLLFGYLYHFSH